MQAAKHPGDDLGHRRPQEPVKPRVSPSWAGRLVVSSFVVVSPSDVLLDVPQVIDRVQEMAHPAFGQRVHVASAARQAASFSQSPRQAVEPPQLENEVGPRRVVHKPLVIEQVADPLEQLDDHEAERRW